jgi:transcriptional regulator with XRE-family HTH domain
MNSPNLTTPTTSANFADRIRFLIQRVGSATEIARMCGFSEGVVRSWRDGNTDPSRARCVTLAKTLGISLVWLVAGEGSLQIDPIMSTIEDQTSGEKATALHRLNGPMRSIEKLATTTVDAKRLRTAVQILQSELSLAGSHLSLSDNTDLLSELYEILGPGGSRVDTLAMVKFNHQLARRIQLKGQTG